MMTEETNLFELIQSSLKGTVVDILPILLVLVFFQGVVLRKKIPHPGF